MKPRTFYLPADNLDRALDDPALMALIQQGWTCSAVIPVSGRQGREDSVDLMLLLWPPAPLKFHALAPERERQDLYSRLVTHGWQVCVLVILVILASFTLG